MARLKVFICLLLGVILAAGAGFVALPRLNEVRRSADLSPGDPLDDTTPGLALTSTLMGGGRGLAVITLWSRAMAMQDEGKYFELVQLFDLIGRLEPHFPSIWQYAAWNMAYNVSVKFPDPQERWRWIRRGIEHARDKGIVYNPRSVDIYFELAWIFFHKVGGVSFDEYSLYYRWQLAGEIQDILGPMPDLDAMVSAPGRDELMADPGVSALVEALVAAGASPFSDPVALTREFGRAEAVSEVLADPAHADALSRLMPCLRRLGIEADWRLDVVRMQSLTERFGPVDWRLPEAHALYWSTRGMEVAGEDDWVANADRVTINSLVGLFRTGRLYFSRSADGPPTYITMADYRFIDSVNEVYALAIERFAGESSEASFKDAQRNFLDDALVLLYTSGRVEEAGRYYDLVAALYPNPDYAATLSDFVANQVESGVVGQQIDQAQGVVQGYVWRALLMLATGDSDQASSLDLFTARAWAGYLADYGEQGSAAPTYDELRRAMVRQFLETMPDDLCLALREQLPAELLPPDSDESSQR